MLDSRDIEKKLYLPCIFLIFLILCKKLDSFILVKLFVSVSDEGLYCLDGKLTCGNLYLVVSSI